MKVFPPERIRNVALVGHNGSGKTTLAEALLYRAGALNRLGRVEDGNTVTDFDPEEHARNMSLSLALAPFEWKGHKVDPFDGAHDEHGEIGHAHCRMEISGEVGVPRGVDEVDLVPLPLEGCQGQ